MIISGLQKMTLLDFPGKVACTVFLQGCNFRCPFCHNSGLLEAADTGFMDTAELLAFKAEEHCADAAGAGVHGHEGFCHGVHPFFIVFRSSFGFVS